MEETPRIDVTWPEDVPFQVGNEIKKDRYFFDREQEVAQLIEAVSSQSRNIHLIEGPRRIGKSSLLRKCEREFGNARTIARVDFSTFRFTRIGRRDAVALTPGEVRDAIFRDIVSQWRQALGLGAAHMSGGMAPRRFREKIVQPLFAIRAEKPLILLIDEAEVLRIRHQAVFEDLVYAIQECDPCYLQAVISEGRQLGQPASSVLRGLLRNAPVVVSVGCFSEEQLATILKVASPLTFDKSTVREIHQETGGHPLLFCALAERLFAHRRKENEPGAVQISDIHAIAQQPELIKIVQGHFDWIWDQVTPLQSVLTRTVADLTWRPERQQFEDWAEFNSVRAAMTRGTYGPSLTEVQDGALFLSNNAVLYVEPDHSRCRLCSPLFGRWIRSLTTHELTTTANPAVSSRLEAAKAARKSQDLPKARQEVTLAIQLFNGNPEAFQLAAEIAEEQKDIDDALSYWKCAVQLQSSLASSLIRFLRNMILAATEGTEPVEVWYQELVAVSEPDVQTREIQTARFEHSRKCWIAYFRYGDMRTSFQSFDIILSMLRDRPEIASNFQGLLLENLNLLLREQLGSTELSYHGTELLVTCFVPLTRIFDQSYDDSMEADLVSDFEGMPQAVEIIRKRYATKRRAPWWDAAIDLLQEAFSRRAPRQGHTIELVSVLRHLVQFAPVSHKKRVTLLLVEHLPSLLSNLLGTLQWDTAAQIMVLLCDLESPPHDQIWLALEVGISELLGLPETGDETVLLDAIRHMANIYSPWIATKPQQVLPDILRQLDKLTKRFRTRIQEKKTVDTWEPIVLAGYEYRNWLRLFEDPFLALAPETTSLAQRMTPPPEVARRIRGQGRPGSGAWDAELPTLLSSRYAYCIPVKASPYGDFGNHLRIYRTTWDGRDIQLKVYRFDLAEQQPAVIRLLEYLWQNERRSLQNLTSHRAGRALVEFYFVDSDFESKGIRILATEPTGDLTLRQAIETHRHLFHDREKLWREIYNLVEAVGAMHRLNHLHRAIRPENIFVKLVPENNDFQFKLANFEWSINLHEIRGPHLESESLDYYYAPEVLAPIFHRESNTRGVSFAADIYSLGLTLYELLVGRFPAGELRKFRRLEEYDPHVHREWLQQLRANIDRHFVEARDVGLMLKMMLQSDSSLRYSNVDDFIEGIALFATESSQVHTLLHNAERPPVMVTTSADGPESTSSIAHFLQKIRPDIQWKGNIESFLQDDLKGAQIYACSGSSALYFKGKEFEFVADRFTWIDKKNARQTVDVPFFRVAGPHDRREGPLLATLIRVKIMSVADFHRLLEQQRHQAGLRAEVWRLLFELAEHSGVKGDRMQRQFYSLLSLTADAEEVLWRKQVIPYERVSYSTEGKTMIVRIKANRTARRVAEENLEPLGRATARQVAREDAYFELLKSDNPLTTGEEGLPWLYVGGNTETGEVELRRQQTSPLPPQFGNIRPLALAGNRAVYQRRQDLLRILEDDSYVLRAVTELNRIRTVEPQQDLSNDDFFDKSLDTAKRRIVNRVLKEPPLFLVQGPPGTGKTTLAAEVVRQTLWKHPSARILIVSQAHDPLDNLLLRVHEVYKHNRSPHGPAGDGRSGTVKAELDTNSPMLVRLLSGSRIRARARTDENRRVQEFIPSNAKDDSYPAYPAVAPRFTCHSSSYREMAEFC